MPDISDVRIHLMVDNQQALAGLRTTEAAVRSTATRMTSSMQNFTTSLNRAGIQMQSIGRYMTTFVTLPLVGLGIAATKSALDMERTFLKIQTLATGVGMSMDDAREKVLEMAHALGQDPQELTEGLYFVASAGLENADHVFPVLEQSAKAAAVGLGDTGTVARLLTSAMNAYAKSGLDAATATEILAEAVAQGTAEPAEFAQYLGSVIPVAAQMGVSFDQVAGAVANATTYGVDAARAVTGLRYALSSLANPTDAAKEVLKDYNLTVEQVQTSLAQPNGLLDTYTMLADTFDLQTTKGKEAWQTVIGGARASIIVNTLVGENAAKTAKIMEQMGFAAEGATGRMERAWNKFEKSDAFKFEQMKADLKTALIDLGQQIIPVLVNDVMPVIEDLIEGWNDLSDSTKHTIVVWGGIAAAAGPVIMTLGTIFRIMSSILSIGGAVARAVSGVITAGTAGAGAAGAAGAAAGGGAALAGGWLAAVAALVGYSAYKLTHPESGDLPEKTQKYMDGLYVRMRNLAKGAELSEEAFVAWARTPPKVVNLLADIGYAMSESQLAMLDAMVETQNYADAVEFLNGILEQSEEINPRVVSSVKEVTGALIGLGTGFGATEAHAINSAIAAGEYRKSVKLVFAAIKELPEEKLTELKASMDPESWRLLQGYWDFLQSFKPKIHQKIVIDIIENREQTSRRGGRVKGGVTGTGQMSEEGWSPPIDTSAIVRAERLMGLLEERTKEAGDEVWLLRQGIDQLPDDVTINVDANTDPATTAVQSFLSFMNGLGTIPINIAARIWSFEKQSAATGGIASGPVLTGEGTYSTFAGTGAEAVIPLDGRGLSILAEALARAGGMQQRGGGARTLVVNVAGKVERPEDLRRELAWWERSRGY